MERLLAETLPSVDDVSPALQVPEPQAAAIVLCGLVVGVASAQAFPHGALAALHASAVHVHAVDKVLQLLRTESLGGGRSTGRQHDYNNQSNFYFTHRCTIPPGPPIRQLRCQRVAARMRL